MEKRTPRPSKGSLASGRLRLRRGRTAKASTRRAGPRSNGTLMRDPISRFLSAAIFSLPSSVRTAHAQAVGPCTSTPFPRAIPPRRSLSLLTLSSVVLGQALEERLQSRRGIPARQLAAVDGDDRHDLAHRRAR